MFSCNINRGRAQKVCETDDRGTGERICEEKEHRVQNSAWFFNLIKCYNQLSSE